MPEQLRGRRVLLVLATSNGGVGRHVADLAAGAVAAGAAVTVAGPAATEELFGFRAAGATFVPVEIALGTHPVADLTALVALRALVGDAEIVHAHGLRAGLLSGLALGRRRTPFVVTWHNAVLGAGGRRRVYARLEQRVAHRATTTLCVSPDLVDRVRSLGGQDVRLAPVGARELPPPSRPVEEIRRELGISGPLVLCVGRLHPQKGLDILVDAAAQLDGTATPFVVIAGEGPERPRLERAISETSAPVRLLGRRDDVPDLLAAADVVVLPSRWEGSPLAAHEALLAGKPLVASSVGGLPHLLGEDGAVFVPPEDPAALAAALDALLGDPQRRARQAAAGRARAVAWPTAATAVESVLELHTELLGHSA